MAILANLYFKLDKLKEIVRNIENNNEKGLSVALSINDEINTYNQNISAYISQSKEQRDAKESKNYIGNGSVIWTDGTITVVPKKDSPPKKQAPAPVQSVVDNTFYAQPKVLSEEEKQDLPF